MDDKLRFQPQTYRITLQGKLDDDWRDWFASFRFSCEKDVYRNTLTILTGTIADQAALRGTLNKLWDLNLSVLTITRLDAETGQPSESGDDSGG